MESPRQHPERDAGAHPQWDEPALAELIAALPPAPPAWVRAACELPAAREAMDEIVERAVRERDVREQVLRDLEGALRRAGVEPRRVLVETLRRRLTA